MRLKKEARCRASRAGRIEKNHDEKPHLLVDG
jgi:hypothetical protein